MEHVTGGQWEGSPKYEGGVAKGGGVMGNTVSSTQGAGATFSALVGATSSLKLNDVLPAGTYFALKNPDLVSRICESPSEVELLSVEDVETIMGPGMTEKPLKSGVIATGFLVLRCRPVNLLLATTAKCGAP